MLKLIRSKKEYKTALNRIYELMQKELKVNSDEYNELDVLSMLVVNYESKTFPIGPPDPIEDLAKSKIRKSAVDRFCSKPFDLKINELISLLK